MSIAGYYPYGQQDDRNRYHAETVEYIAGHEFTVTAVMQDGEFIDWHTDAPDWILDMYADDLKRIAQDTYNDPETQWEVIAD